MATTNQTAAASPAAPLATVVSLQRGTAAAASNKRYGAAIAALNPAFAARTFTLTRLGQAAVAAGGAIGKNGQVTVMGATAVAVGIAANGGTAATGAAIVTAMLNNPALLAAFAASRAKGTHVVTGTALHSQWCAGYVKGLCIAKHGLAA